MEAIKMNTSLSPTTSNAGQMSNYCILPHQSHQNYNFTLTNLFNNGSSSSNNDGLFNKHQEVSILAAVTTQNRTKSNDKIEATVEGEKNALALHKSASGEGISNQGDSSLMKAEQNLLDPYIDAVQVKSRVNNRRGPRVKALVSPRATAHHHQSSPSYRTQVQVIKGNVGYVGKKGGDYNKDNYDYGDSSDDDSDGDEENHTDGKKVIYVKEVVSHYLGGSGYHAGHKGGAAGGGGGGYQPYQQGHMKGGYLDGGYQGKQQYGGGGKKRAHRKGKRKGSHNNGHTGRYRKKQNHRQHGNKYHHHQHNYHHKGYQQQQHHHQKQQKYPMGHHHYQQKNMNNNKQKKVTYAYVIQPVVKKIPVLNEKQEQHYDGHKQQHHYGQAGQGKHHGYHGDYHGGGGGGNKMHGHGGKGGYGANGGYGGKSGAVYGQQLKHQIGGGGGGSGKHHLVQVDMMDKGKLNIAGLLGYTLLCVNYLLLLQQPTSYNKYNGGYSKYSPHGAGGAGTGEMVAIKSGGPIILASCSEIPAGSQTFDHSRSPMDTPIRNNYLHQATNVKMDHEATMASSSTPQSTMAQTAATLPPPATYFYTLDPSSKATLSGGGGGQPHAPGKLQKIESGLSLSSVQSYVHRLVIPAGGDDVGDTPIRVVRGPPPSHIRLPATGESPANRRRLVLSAAPGRVGSARASLEIFVDNGGAQNDGGLPQVVGAQDNLLGLRRRPVPVGMRVVVRRNKRLFKANGSARPLRLLNDERDWMLLAGRGILPHGDQVVTMIQADQSPSPKKLTNNTTTNSSEVKVRSGGDESQATVASGNNNNNNNRILDLPDYALSGDSIELTCNHRMPTSRLYSVKWFKDSMEFYRFIPANGARAKSSLFMPDVRLDLGRSNSETLFLRNVTHRASGQYRCEVVSEGPNFETLGGEKRMQVYTLPESGPQISVVERPERPAVSSPAPLFPQLLQTMLPLLNTEGWPNSAQQQQQQQPLPVLDGPLVRCTSARSNPAAQLRFFINNRPIDLGRIVENSTLSYSDGMEAMTASFRLILTDFKLDQDQQQRRAGGGGSSLERGASNVKLDSKQALKQAANPQRLAGGSGNSTSQKRVAPTPTTVVAATTTTTTTSTTPKPTLKDSSSSSNNNTGSKQIYANANVHFDDNNLPVKLEEFKAALEAAKRKQTGGGQGVVMVDNEIDKKQKLPATNGGDDDNAGDEEQPMDDEPEQHDGHEPEDAAAALAPADPVLAPLPAQLDKANSDRKSTLVKTNIVGIGSPSVSSVAATTTTGANQGDLVRPQRGFLRAKQNHHHHQDHTRKPEPRTQFDSSSSSSSLLRSDGEHDDDEQQQLQHHGANVPNVASMGQPNKHQHRLSRTVRQATAEQQQGARLAGADAASDDAMGADQEVFSSYIRIKCTSLMPAVGYEMASELNVPLTFLVPASQLSDASTSTFTSNRQQQQLQSTSHQQQQQQANRNQDDTLRGRQVGDDASGRTAIRNGGSIQAPRAVLIDRVAQGSAPPSRSIVSPNGNNKQTINGNSTTTSNGTAIVANRVAVGGAAGSGQPRRAGGPGASQAAQTLSSAQASRNRALEQRSKYLEEVGKLSKPASNGSSSYLAIMRSLMGGSSSRISNRPGQHQAGATTTGFVSYQLTMTLATAAWLAISYLTSKEIRTAVAA